MKIKTLEDVRKGVVLLKAPSTFITGTAAKRCTGNHDIEELTKDKQTEWVQKMFKVGHTSTTEFDTIVFALNCLSRAASHQLVRFRVGTSFAQLSQRYVNENGHIEFILSEHSKQHTSLYQKIEEVYHEAIAKDVPAEDAREILPNATVTKMVFGMNMRSLDYMMKKRLCKRAQLEIRTIFQEMADQLKTFSPEGFKHLGPPCKKGYCPEGPLQHLDCKGKIPTLKQLLKGSKNGN